MFELQVGPLPYFRRPGTLVHIAPLHRDHDNPRKFRLGVIVAHKPGVHGCKYGEGVETRIDERCYFCQDNPFYEVDFGGSESTCRIQPERVVERVLETGTKLLLKMEALERVVPGFRYADQPRSAASHSASGSVHSRKMEMLGGSECVAASAAAANGKRRRIAPSDEEGGQRRFVRCFLNITPIMYAKDGMVCIAIATSTRAKNEDPKVRPGYILLQHMACRSH